MNNTIKIIAAVFLTAVSSASFAKTEYYATERVAKIGDKIEQGYVRSGYFGRPGIFNNLKENRVVIQFNVRSTNKSQYNAIYLENHFDQVDVPGEYFCEPVEDSSNGDVVGESIDRSLLVTYLPYSPHKEKHDNVEWANGWRSVHVVVRVPEVMQQEYMALRVCSRDKHGGVDGDLDDFEIKDMVIHYQTEDEVQPD